jgi:hypothetical protein
LWQRGFPAAQLLSLLAHRGALALLAIIAREVTQDGYKLLPRRFKLGWKMIVTLKGNELRVGNQRG